MTTTEIATANSSPRIWINEMEFNDGTKISFSRSDITVFVGPNNAGKSASLKEAAKLIKSPTEVVKVLKSITLSKEGNFDEVIKLLDKYTSREVRRGMVLYNGSDYSIWQQAVKEIWDNPTEGMGDLSKVFVNVLSTELRITAANPQKAITIDEPTQHPIHHLYRDDGLEQKFSDYFRQAFKTDLIVHRAAGPEIPLYVGEKPESTVENDRVSRKYVTELQSRDTLHTQGDGMRSFVGVLLNSVISDNSILFIDEPEAFLHPPQARLLGKMLGQDVPSTRQLFLATHSEDFLKGLLDANVSNLNVIRIQRDGTINKISVLNGSDIDEIWKDSLLRHSNVLSGLFHSQVIICESDSDCRFYSAIQSVLAEVDEKARIDTLYIHCGGKQRIPTVLKALRSLNVPIKIVSDFDILDAEKPLRDIFENLGGNWNKLSSDFNLVKTSIDQKRPELETRDLKDKITAILNSVSEQIFPKEKVKEIQHNLKRTSAWIQAKEGGKSFIPSGAATQAFERLVKELQNLGMFIVEIGELESFVKTVGNHGPKWVNEVMAKDLKEDIELQDARNFVSRLVE